MVRLARKLPIQFAREILTFTKHSHKMQRHHHISQQQPSSITMTYSANDNQNYFVTRPTSRVLSQPGGQSSFTLGGWTPEELERMRLRREAAEQEAQQKPVADEVPPAKGKKNSCLLQWYN